MTTTVTGLDATLRQIYGAAAKELSGVMDTRNMYIALYDDLAGQIEFPLAYERGVLVPDADRAAGKPYAPRRLGERNGLTEWVIRHSKPLLIQKNFSDWCQSQADVEVFPMGTKCWLGAPMVLGTRVVGVIGLQSFDRDAVFDSGHLSLLKTIAGQAAVALENARLMGLSAQAFQERQRRLDIFRRISEKIAEAVADPGSVLALVVEAARQATQADLISLYRYDDTAQKFTGGVRLASDSGPTYIQHDALPEADSVVAEVAEKQAMVYEENATSAFAQRNHIRTYAALPLAVAGPQGVRSTVGVLFANFKNPHHFSDDEKEILEHLAVQAAIAIAFAEARTSSFANEQLAALGTAAGTLQHRLGNTINITLPAVMRLRGRVRGDRVSEDILNTIERNTQFAIEVIQRMQMPLRAEPFVPANINSLLREAVLKMSDQPARYPQARLCCDLYEGEPQPAEESAALPRIEIKVELGQDLPETFATVGRITEVFRVLVENAIKAIYPRAGVVQVHSALRSGRRGEIIEVTVEDNGKGIEEGIRGRLFRQPVPRKEFGEGAGLGLWLSRFIVRSHQGDIAVAWTEPGKGTRFRVHLPVLLHPPIQAEDRGGQP